MKGSKKGSKVTKSSGSPKAYGAKPVSMAGPTSSKSADNVTKRTSGSYKPGSK